MSADQLLNEVYDVEPADWNRVDPWEGATELIKNLPAVEQRRGWTHLLGGLSEVGVRSQPSLAPLGCGAMGFLEPASKDHQQKSRCQLPAQLGEVAPPGVE